MTSLYPEYAVGIRAARTIPQDAFGQPRCLKNAIHGAKVGAWECRMINGKLVRVTHWERVTP